MLTTALSRPSLSVDDADRPHDRDERARELLHSALTASDEERRRLQQQVVLDYLDVADAVARRYRGALEDWLDLRQVAYVGLTKAVQRFRPDRGRDMVAFAVPTIAGEIKRHLRDTSWVIRPPRRLQERSTAIRDDAADLRQRLGREPTVAELADRAGMTRQETADALRCWNGRRPASLDLPAHQESPVAGTATLGDTIPSEALDFDQVDIRDALEHACRALTPREREIVRLRFYEEMTQAQIARRFGVTQMQISRILARALGTLRERLTPDLLAA